MACKEETTVVDGMEVYCRQMAAQDSLTMKFRLVKTLGPALAELPGLLSDEKSEADEDVEKLEVIGKIIDSLFASSSPSEITRLIMDVINTANIDGSKMNDSLFDQKFSGDIKTAYKVFAFVVRVNYADFFGAKLVQGLADKAKESGLT